MNNMFPSLGANGKSRKVGLEPILAVQLLHAVVSPGPDRAESELLHAVWRARPFVKGIAAEDNAKVLKKSFQPRRIEGQTGEFDSVAVHVQYNGFVPRHDQLPQDPEIWSFASEKLNEQMGVVQRTRIDNHCNQSNESDLPTERKFEFTSPPDVLVINVARPNTRCRF